MTRTNTLSPPLLDDIARAIGVPHEIWHARCHEISLKVIKSGALDVLAESRGRPRVARGWCRGVTGQHSWIMFGDDPYKDSTLIMDPTLFTFRDDIDGIYVASYGDAPQLHRAHGHGLPLMDAGPPQRGGDGERVELAGRDQLSVDARAWLDMIEGSIGVLDRDAWMALASGTMVGWPAGEVIDAMMRTPGMRAWVPIDIVGMLTDRNPSGLYLDGPSADDETED